MLEAIVKHGIIFYAMGITMGIGILAKVISHITVRKMVTAASEIQKSEHKLMRLVKAKFEHASMVSDKVQNVKAFVKKYLYEYKVLGMRLGTWQGIQIKAVWILATLGIIGGFASYSLQGMNEQTFQYISWTGILTTLLLLIHMLTDEKIRLEAAENYMVDYLENVCIHRYEKASQSASKVEEIKPSEPEIKEETESTRERMEQEMRIRAILEEFLA